MKGSQQLFRFLQTFATNFMQMSRLVDRPKLVNLGGHSNIYLPSLDAEVMNGVA